MKTTVCTALLALTAATGALAQSPASLIVSARAQIEDIQPDSAVSLLTRALDPRAGATNADLVRGWTLMGVSELIRGHASQARLAFRRALDRDPALRVDTLVHLHSDLRRVFIAERDAWRNDTDLAPVGLAIRMPIDTTIVPGAGQYFVEVQPRRPARVIATITTIDTRSDVIWADTANVTTAGVMSWDLRGRGPVVAPGRYQLRVIATDSIGRTSVPQTRILAVSRAYVDTLNAPDYPDAATTPDLPAPRRSTAGLLAGGALGIGAIALTTIMGNKAINGGHADGASYAIAGAVSIASVVAFFSGHRAQPQPATPASTSEAAARYERRRLEVTAENARRIAAAPIRVRVEGNR